MITRQAEVFWLPEARQRFAQVTRAHYAHMERHGASAAELQEIAWVTYLGNIYTEEKIA